MKWMRVFAAMVVAVGLCGGAMAQHAHEEPNVEPPKTLAEGLKRIEQQQAALNKALVEGSLKDADGPAYTLAELTKNIGRVALADPSVPKERVKAINLIGRAAAAEAEAVHEDAEASQLQPAMMHFAKLKPLLTKLVEASNAPVVAKPETFVCEMHCEGVKQYDKPGTCPVCKMELTALSKTPYYAKVSSPTAVEAGQPVTLEIKLLQPTGEPLDKVDTVHEYPLHFMLMSEDLSFYSHQHPRRKPDGTFVLERFTFPFGGKFFAYSDFTPTGAENQVSKYEFKVRDGGAPLHENVKLESNFDGVGKDGDYEFRVRCNGQDFIAGEDMFMRYGIDLKSKPVTDLQPLMGAMGHLVIVSSDFKHYVHAHPLDFDEKKEGGKGEAAHDHAGHGHDEDAILKKGREMLLGNGNKSDVVFHVVFPEPGLYRAFAQFQHKGKLLTYPVTIDVKPNPSGKAGETAPKTDHSKHDHGKTEAPAGGK